jgi:prepilin-type N-terminal cleavage/methylation domain-containing protein
MKCQIRNNYYCVSGLNQEGFSLIEVLIALAIFTFIIGGVVKFSVNSIKANIRSQAMQESIDNARYAMDDLAKKIRTSSSIVLTGAGNNELFLIDNKTLVKYCYRFENDKMTVSKFEPTIGNDGSMTPAAANLYNAVAGCNDLVVTSSIVGETGGNVAIGGKFELLVTDIFDDIDPHRGFVRIIIDMIYNDSGAPENRAEVHLQSGVSIADYEREDDFELNATASP